LGDNAREYYFSLAYKPLRGLILRLNYIHADKGADYPDIRRPYVAKHFMDKVEWSNRSLSFRGSYEIFHDFQVFAEFAKSNITAVDQTTLDKYTAPFYQGERFITSFGVNFNY
jgi:hypothetical protein